MAAAADAFERRDDAAAPLSAAAAVLAEAGWLPAARKSHSAARQPAEVGSVATSGTAADSCPANRAAVLAEAGWLPAARFAGQLSAAVPLVATEPTSAGWRAALFDSRAAVGRHNLRELACSPVLFE
ncbi:hypothetical protein QM326_38075, partial [Burkholderia cenocepacia]|nr:hypothetical protein [Burkholderia cenocepacia]